MYHQIEIDIMYLEILLPNTYEIKKSQKGIFHIHCYSKFGIENEDVWKYIFNKIKNKFGERFEEIGHKVNTFHKDFTIFLKYPFKT